MYRLPLKRPLHPSFGKRIGNCVEVRTQRRQVTILIKHHVALGAFFSILTRSNLFLALIAQGNRSSVSSHFPDRQVLALRCPADDIVVVVIVFFLFLFFLLFFSLLLPPCFKLSNKFCSPSGVPDFYSSDRRRYYRYIDIMYLQHSASLPWPRPTPGSNPVTTPDLPPPQDPDPPVLNRFDQMSQSSEAARRDCLSVQSSRRLQRDLSTSDAHVWPS